MVSAPRILSCVIAVLAACAACAVAACGSLIGIEDGTLDPELNGSEGGTSGTDSGIPPKDSGAPMDGAALMDAAHPKGPLAAPGGSATSLPCTGSSTCAIPGEVCCAYKTSSGFTGQCAKTCSPPGTGERLVAMKCGGPFSCPAEKPRCCLSSVFSSSSETSCQSSCGSFPAVRLCNLSAGDCGDNYQCTPFNFGDALPQAYGHCRYTGG